jgi:hypothetical protein
MKGSPNQLFIDQRTQQAIRSLEGARLRAQREHTLIGVALVVSRVQVNQLVRSLPLVRAAMVRMQAETQRHAARLAAEQVIRYQTEPRSEAVSNALCETILACSKVFPREAALLRRSCPM